MAFEYRIVIRDGMLVDDGSLQRRDLKIMAQYVLLSSNENINLRIIAGMTYDGIFNSGYF